MAQELGTGYIIISPSTKGLGKAIEGSISNGTASGTQKSGKSIISTIGGAFGKIGKVGVGTIAGIASGIAGLTAKGGFDRALNIERAQTKLKALKYDTASVDKIMGNALASVKGTAFGLGDAASVAATLVASGIKQGGDLEGVLTTVGDAAQISGRSFQDMGLIFSQVAAKGKLQGDDMLQLMGSGIPVLQYLADHFHTTTEAASDMVSDGKVSFADFEAAMKEHIGGAAKNAGESFDGMVGNVKAAIGRLGAQFETPLLNAATKVGGKLIPIIDQTTSATGKLADQFAGRLDTAASIAAQKIEDLGNSIASGKTSIADLAAQAATLAGGFATLATVGGNADKIVSVLDQLGKSGDKGIADLIANLKKEAATSAEPSTPSKHKSPTPKATSTQACATPWPSTATPSPTPSTASDKAAANSHPPPTAYSTPSARNSRQAWQTSPSNGRTAACTPASPPQQPASKPKPDKSATPSPKASQPPPEKSTPHHSAAPSPPSATKQNHCSTKPSATP